MKAERIFKSEARLGEGALWHEPSQELWWVDIDRHCAHSFNPRTGKNKTVQVGDTCSTIVPAPDGYALVTRGCGVAMIDFCDGSVTPYPVLPEEPAGNRLNDGKCDPFGRLWVGGLALNGCPTTSNLHRLDPDGQWTRVLDGVGCSNGLAWSTDSRTFYYIDTLTQRVDAFDFEYETGTLSRRRSIFEFAEAHGYPDGMTIDVEGRLWIALWGGSRVCCLDPRQKCIVDSIELPTSLVTSCAFGGERLDQLFITTACGDDNVESEAGSLFIVEPKTRGLAASIFGSCLKQ
jgi:sugar lactone lactonase YvrE